MKKFRPSFRLEKRPDVRAISDRVLLINLYLTQLVVLLVAVLLIAFAPATLPDRWYEPPADMDWLWPIVIASVILALNVIVSAIVPEHWIDDGGVGEKLFGNRPLWHIVLICAVVALSEELLFRAAVQPMFGNYWTSVLFAAIHVRYYRHWILMGMVFISSLSLGWLFDQTGSVWSPIAAHFAINFVLACMMRGREGHKHGNEV